MVVFEDVGSGDRVQCGWRGRGMNWKELSLSHRQAENAAEAPAHSL